MQRIKKTIEFIKYEFDQSIHVMCIIDILSLIDGTLAS